MDQTQWSVQDGGNAALTLLHSGQQYSGIADGTGQDMYAYEVPGLSSEVGGGYVLQLPDGTTTFVSADSVITESPEISQTATSEMRASTKRHGASRQSLLTQVNGESLQEQQTVSLLKPLKQDSSKGATGESHQNQQSSKLSDRSKHKKVSILQSNWPQLQEAAAGNTELADPALQMPATQAQQTSLFADGLADVKPGDKVYVSIDGVTYEIVTDESGEQYAIEAGHELTQQAAAEMGSLSTESTGIGLAELATLSAERETIQLINYQAGAGDGTRAVVSQGQGLELVQSADGPQLQGTDQQYMELVQQTQGTGNEADHDAMQVYLVPTEGEQGSQTIVVPASDVDVKQSVQDLMFQHDPQLQEMVAKGFDLSNCHFVIQEDGQSNGTVYMTATSSGVPGSFGQDLQQQLVSAINSSGYVAAQAGADDLAQSIAYVNGSESSNVLTILADPSTLQQHELIEGQTKMMWSTLTPEDFDDGEFDHLRQDLEETLLNSIVAQSFPAVSLPIDHYLRAYKDFINGNKIETLSSVANSTVSKRPQLPKYEPDVYQGSRVCNRLGTDASAVTFVYANESGSVIQKTSSRSLLKPNLNSVKRPRDLAAEDDKSFGTSNVGVRQISTKAAKLLVDKEGKIIKRKRRGSDEDSYDDSDGELGSDSDPLWKPEVETPKSSISSSQLNLSARHNRGRGRPRGSGHGAKFVQADAQRPVDCLPSASVFTPLDLDEPHNYQKGDFVIEKKDRYNAEGFPIWKIESGRLLQKYDPFLSDAGVLHKSVSIYSSWSGDVRANFKAIMVEVVTTTGRKCEIVKVLDSYLPKSPDDSLENDVLMELFTVYLQVLISQAIDANFFASIEQGQEEYYLGPVEQIDNLLIQAKQEAALNALNWNENFKATMEQRPFCKITKSRSELEIPQVPCQATVDVGLRAMKDVKFYGPLYDRKSLEVTKAGKVLTSQEFAVSQLAADNLTTYHGLHHFKFLLYKKCQEEVQFIRQNNLGQTDKDVLEDCLRNRIFVQQGLQDLKNLLEKCSIHITVVTKTDDAPE